MRRELTITIDDDAKTIHPGVWKQFTIVELLGIASYLKFRVERMAGQQLDEVEYVADKASNVEQPQEGEDDA